jgi:hypothetical protein
VTAWRVGREAALAEPVKPHVASDTTGANDGKKYLDVLLKYFPAEIAAAYTVAIGLWVETAKEQPAVWLALLFTALTALLVVGGWRQAGGDWKKPSVERMLPELALALAAFCAWSLAIPGTGWLGITVVANNQSALPIIGIAAGLALPACVLIAKGSAPSSPKAE